MCIRDSCGTTLAFLRARRPAAVGGGRTCSGRTEEWTQACMDEGYGHSIGMSKRPIDAVRYKNIPGKAHEPLSLQLWSGRPFAFETPACVHCRERTEAPTLGRLEWFFHSWHNMVFKNVYLLMFVLTI